MAILALFTALLFAAASTPLVRRFALRMNFVDQPKADRAHAAVTPMMGGVAIYLSLTLAMLAFALLATTPLTQALVNIDVSMPWPELAAIILAGTVIAAVGLLDDRRPFPPRVKFALQVPAVLLLALTTSVKIALPIPEVLNIFLTLCWLLYIINAFNYLDNMDGVAATAGAVAATFFTVIAVMNRQVFVAVLAAALAGTLSGFLRYNLFTPNLKIFMGDSGSLFLGFLLAVLGVKLRFDTNTPWITWPIPVLVLGIPIFDTGLVFISRMRRRVGFLRGGIDHTSHRLLRLGLGQYGVPLALGLIGAALGCAALILVHGTLLDSVFVQVIVALIALYALYRLEFKASFELRTGKPAPSGAENE